MGFPKLRSEAVRQAHPSAGCLRTHARHFIRMLIRTFGLETLVDGNRRWRKMRRGDRAVIAGWAVAELAPWHRTAPSRTVLTEPAIFAAFDALNRSAPTVVVLDVRDGRVRLRPKPDDLPALDPAWAGRPEMYRALIEDALGPDDRTSTYALAIDIADMPRDDYDVPVFSFQKRAGSKNILLPDPDFILQNWYIGWHVDRRPFRSKRTEAVFAGSSTGVLQLTAPIVENDATTRLGLAARLVGHRDIRFHICEAVQCDGEATERLLRAKQYFSSDWVPLLSQYESKFLLSVDGNGPTCSRIVYALLSNCVLVKQDSPQVLYFFRGLAPGVHYLRFADVADIEDIVRRETSGDLRTGAMRAEATRFARTFLSKPAVHEYTRQLLEGYASTLRDR